MREQKSRIETGLSRRHFHGAALATALGVLAARARSGIAAQAQAAGSRDGGYVIWDMHCHLSNVSGTPEERTAQLLEYADRVGIDRLVVFLGMPPYAANPTPEQLTEANNHVLRAVDAGGHRVLGFVYVNPDHVDASLAEMERCIRNGPMVGVKLWIAQRCSAASLDPIIRRATELQAVVYQHTWLKAAGNEPGESTPSDLATLAARHPKAKLVCGHAGGDWERGIRVIRSFPNVVLGISGFDPTAGVIEMAVRELGPERILYGSDVGGRSFASQLAKVLGADVSRRAKQMILGENLHRLLHPILKAKGMDQEWEFGSRTNQDA